MLHTYSVGDRVIYRRPKASERPGPRAKNIQPATGGDLYRYQVDKFWTVSAVHENSKVEVITRRGKRHIIHTDDPRLRKARFYHALLWRKKFPSLDTTNPV